MQKESLTPRLPLPLRIAVLFLGLAVLATAEPFKLLAIGDSLSEEYRFETPFSAPDSNPFVANTKNWVELLHDHREAEFSMGGYEPSLGNYADYRNAGYEYNYGVPGFKAEKWEQVLTDPELADLSTWVELRRDLSAVDAVLIFVGGNDLSLADSVETHNRIRDYIENIHGWVRDNGPANLPIIISTVPDIGATPKEQTENPAIADPADAAASRQRVAALNANIIALGSLPNTYIARIDAVTDFIFDNDPIHINGTEFSFPPHPENPPLTFFCKLGFHPATAGQAIIANEILKAVNQFAATPVPLFANREILTIIGSDPDGPLTSYLGNAPDDGDALPGLLEYLLNGDPGKADAAFTFSPDGSAVYTPSESALRYATLTPMQSATLTDDWEVVPQNRLVPLTGGAISILPDPEETDLFYRLEGLPKP